MLAEHPRGTAAGIDAAFDILHGSRFVDLTQTFGPDTPHWKGFPGETVKTLYTVEKDGFTPTFSTMPDGGAPMSIRRRISTTG